MFVDSGLETELIKRGVDIRATPIKTGSNPLLTLLSAFGPALLIIGIYVWLFRRAAKQGGGMLGGFGGLGTGARAQRHVQPADGRRHVAGRRRGDHAGQAHPPAQGHVALDRDATILFAPDVRFPQATTYAVEIPAGTKSATGGTLKQPAKFTFETPPPAMSPHIRPARRSTWTSRCSCCSIRRSIRRRCSRSSR